MKGYAMLERRGAILEDIYHVDEGGYVQIVTWKALGSM
jgi:hypothetical protein